MEIKKISVHPKKKNYKIDKNHTVDIEPEKKASSVDLQAAAAKAEIYQFLIIFLLSFCL